LTEIASSLKALDRLRRLSLAQVLHGILKLLIINGAPLYFVFFTAELAATGLGSRNNEVLIVVPTLNLLALIFAFLLGFFITFVVF
jgi:hypothetical protein